MTKGNRFTLRFPCPTRSSERRWQHLAALAALGVVLGVLLMGCTVNPSDLQRDPFMRDMMSLQNQVDQPHKMGQSFDVGNTRWKISAAHAALTLRLGSTVVKAKGKFVVIDFRFTNTSAQTQQPTADMLQIEDAQLASYKGDARTTALLSTWQKTPNFLQTHAQPNKAINCSLVFDLPVSTSGLTLAFQSFPTQDNSMPGM